MCPPRPEPRLSAPAQPVVRLRPRTPTLDPRTLALLLFSGLYRSVSFSGRPKTEILDAGAAMTKAQAGEGSRRSDRTPDSSVRSAGGGGDLRRGRSEKKPRWHWRGIGARTRARTPAPCSCSATPCDLQERPSFPPSLLPHARGSPFISLENGNAK